jgi:hypothetical protein
MDLVGIRRSDDGRYRTLAGIRRTSVRRHPTSHGIHRACDVCSRDSRKIPMDPLVRRRHLPDVGDRTGKSIGIRPKVRHRRRRSIGNSPLVDDRADAAVTTSRSCSGPSGSIRGIRADLDRPRGTVPGERRRIRISKRKRRAEARRFRVHVFRTASDQNATSPKMPNSWVLVSDASSRRSSFLYTAASLMPLRTSHCRPKL